jgi:AraC family transcriptional regulator
MQQRIEQMNESIDYIEAHLTDEIKVEQLARIATCSVYDYQRIYGALYH